MVPIIIVIAVVALIGLFVVFTYNRLVTLNQRSEEAWSDITVQLKRRYDLIPNLVNTVKGYAAHESGVFQRVTEARANAIDAHSVQEQAKSENMLQDTLKSLFAVAEAYPDLKASQNFIELQSEITDTEDKIQASRRFYNGVVRDFNTSRTVFPSNLVAKLFTKFKQDKEFFELDDAQTAAVAEPVPVQF